MRKNSHLYWFVVLINVAISLTLPFPVFAQSNNASTPNPAAEKWVLQQIKLGQPADLKAFPEGERALSAEFFLNLLENPDIEIKRSGITIQNAVFVGPLELDYITVDYPIWLEDCTFQDRLNLYESHFTGDLYLIGSTFLSRLDMGFSRIDGNFVADGAKFRHTDEAANFNSMRVGGLFAVAEAEFEGSVDFGGTDVGVQFDAESAHFNSKEGFASFNGMKVDGSVFLTNAKFWSEVDFITADIQINLYAEDTYFHNPEQLVSFNSINVGRSLVLSRAKFWGPVNFVNAEIGSVLDVSEAHFNHAEEQISFGSMSVGRLLFLRNAEFEGPANFIAAQVRGDVLAGGVHFNNKDGEVTFNSMKVDRSMFLYERGADGTSEEIAEFAGPVDFGYIQVGSTFEAHKARFKNKEGQVNFNSMKVNGSVFLTEAEFAGPVNLGYAQIGSTLEANGTRFQNRNQLVTFNSMKVNGIVFLKKAEFAGPVDFVRAEVGSNFEANDIRFHNKNTEPAVNVNFESMRVEGNMILDGAVFARNVSFRFVEIRNNLEVWGADFQGMDSPPSFNNMTVRQEASFTGTTFQKGADFDNANFLDLIIGGTTRNRMKVSDVRLNQTLVERKLDLNSLEVQNLSCISLVVRGLTNVRFVNILNSANFENSQLGNLSVEKVNWPADLESVNLGGMSYQNIVMILESTPENDWQQLIALVNQTKYNAQTYTTLENYFLEQGYSDRADEVYINYKVRERREGFEPFSTGWWWNSILWPIGYGRKPGYVLIGALVFIVIGWLWVFREREGMVSLSKREMVGPTVGNRGTLSRKIPRRTIPAEPEVPYHPFWYSLDLFIPFVDLGFDDKWCPKSNRKWANIYAKIHMLAGWILIPIGLLAVTGVIK